MSINHWTGLGLGLLSTLWLACTDASERAADAGTAPSDANSSTANPMDRDGQPSPACRDLDEAACKAEVTCAAAYGRPIDEATGCLEAQRFAGCLETDQECTDAETEAQANDGTCWWFSSGCNLPDFDYNACPSPRDADGTLHDCE